MTTEKSGGDAERGADGAERAEPSDDAVWSRQEPESPCVKICVIQPATGYCVGCGRTIDEISRWGGMSADERAGLRAALPERLATRLPRDQRPSARRRARGGRPDGQAR